MLRALFIIIGASLELIACGYSAAEVHVGAPAVVVAPAQQQPQQPDPPLADPAMPAGDPACQTVKFGASPSRRPIDVILWIDDGGSFNGARAKVAASINQNLSDILGVAGVDYRVILLTASTAVGPPLSTSGRLVRVPGGFSAGSGGFVFFSSPTYIAKYAQHLRADAFKVFLSATDCEGSTSAGTFASFETELVNNGAGAFRGGPDRNFIYDMIGNVAVRTPTTAPWLASDPVAGKGSYSSFPACPTTQDGAIQTGGFRLGVSAPTYDELFKQIAETSVLKASLPCSFDVPLDAGGMPLPLERVKFTYTPGSGGADQLYPEVASEAACTAAGGFFTANGRLELCPATCSTVKADPAGEVKFSFICRVS